MITITAVAYTAYPVTDMGRARRFYEDVLKLKPGSVWEHEGRAWIEYAVGSATLAIANISDEWKPSSAGPSVALEVDDYDAALEALRAQGIPVLVDQDHPTCRLAVVNDPDGNSLIIHRVKSNA